MSDNTKNTAPVDRVRVGLVTAAIFENERNGKNGKYTARSVVLQRAYQDQNDKWQHTNSFNIDDLPKAILALTKAYEALVVKQDTPEEEAQ